MPSLASQRSSRPDLQQPVRHVRPGRVFIMEYTPTYPDAIRYTKGVSKTSFTPEEVAKDGRVFLGLINTLDSILGREQYAMRRNPQTGVLERGDLLEPSKKVIYGVVSACGIECERASTLLFPDALRDPHFPLPPGTLCKLSNAVDQRVSPNELEFNNWDLHEYKLPGEYHNAKRWGLLTEELQELVKKAQAEGERYE